MDKLTENTDNLKKETNKIREETKKLGEDSGVNKHIEKENRKLENLRSISKVIRSSKERDTETTRLETESGMLKEQNKEIANTETFSTISLIHQHPSRFITSNMIDTTTSTSTSTSKSNSISSIIGIPESISFSPHLENASIMKLIIMLVVTLCLTHFFILYRHHIYRFLDKVQSNKVIKTTFYNVF